MKRLFFATLILFVSGLSAACDPEDEIREYFSDQLLHQVPNPTESSLALGAVFLSLDNRPSDALGNMFDTYDQAGWLSDADISEDDNIGYACACGKHIDYT